MCGILCDVLQKKVRDTPYFVHHYLRLLSAEEVSFEGVGAKERRGR